MGEGIDLGDDGSMDCLASPWASRLRTTPSCPRRASPSLFDPSDPIPSRFNLMVNLERQRDELVRPREAPKNSRHSRVRLGLE